MEILALSGLLVVVVVILAIWHGKSTTTAKVNKDNEKVADEQLKQAVNRPSIHDVLDRMRDGKF